ncbi:MAG: hypothetical protein RLP02_34760 [Coleofasciculus sp. C2-GNP5-27]
MNKKIIKTEGKDAIADLGRAGFATPLSVMSQKLVPKPAPTD